MIYNNKWGKKENNKLSVCKRGKKVLIKKEKIGLKRKIRLKEREKVERKRKRNKKSVKEE